MELPSFASDDKKSLYSDLLYVNREQVEQSPIFWNWVTAGVLTGPTLKKIFILKELLERTSILSLPIVEFGSGMGTKVFTLLNIQSTLPQSIRPVFCFDSLLGYSDSGKLSLSSFKDKVISNYKSMNRIQKDLYQVDFDLIHFNVGVLPESLSKIDKNLRFSICFIDVQSGYLTIELLEWAMVNVHVGGIIVVEGVNSPFFPEVSSLLEEFVIPIQFKELHINWEFTLILEKLDYAK